MFALLRVSLLPLLSVMMIFILSPFNFVRAVPKNQHEFVNLSDITRLYVSSAYAHIKPMGIVSVVAVVQDEEHLLATF